MLLRFIHYTYMVEHQMKGAKNMSEIQNAIEVKNLKKGFGGRVLFENFSLNVKANTIHAIIGPNGSGKTTLLRLITGVYQPNAGTINIAGKYAMQLENDYLYEEQTGLENLKIFGKYFGFEINDRSDGYCTQLGLTEHLGKRVSTYSKGMKRKLSLLIVIMIGRDILLMDEPTSGVDPISRVEIRSLIEALKADGKTVIITSHDLSEIFRFSGIIPFFVFMSCYYFTDWTMSFGRIVCVYLSILVLSFCEIVALNIIVLDVKRVKLFKNVLFFGNFALVYLIAMSAERITEFVNQHHIGIDYLIIVVDVALCMMFALLSFFKARHMSNETVIRRDGEWV